MTNPRIILESSNKPKIFGSATATQNPVNKKKRIIQPKLAGQNQRFSPGRGRISVLTSTLNEITSTIETSNPHVVPRYHSLLTKLTSIYSVTADNVTIRKKKI